MTHETKAGLVVTCSFLSLVGVAAFTKWGDATAGNQTDVPAAPQSGPASGLPNLAGGAPAASIEPTNKMPALESPPGSAIKLVSNEEKNAQPQEKKTPDPKATTQPADAKSWWGGAAKDEVKAGATQLEKKADQLGQAASKAAEKLKAEAIPAFDFNTAGQKSSAQAKQAVSDMTRRATDAVGAAADASDKKAEAALKQAAPQDFWAKTLPKNDAQAGSGAAQPKNAEQTKTATESQPGQGFALPVLNNANPKNQELGANNAATLPVEGRSANNSEKDTTPAARGVLKMPPAQAAAAPIDGVGQPKLQQPIAEVKPADVNRASPVQASSPSSFGSFGDPNPRTITPPVSLTSQQQRDAPPVGATPTASTLPMVASAPLATLGAPQVESYDEETYTCKAGDSFRRISQYYYQSDKYDQALMQFNKQHPLAAPAMKVAQPELKPGQVLFIPPARILEKSYRNLVAEPQANGAAAWNRNVTPASDQPAALPAGAAERRYRVRPPGEMMLSIAQRTMKNGNRWTDIYKLNSKYDPKDPVPGGTELRLPGDAVVEAADKP